MFKKIAFVLWGALIVGAPLYAWDTHQEMNSARVVATWQQPVITIDDAMMDTFAFEWELRGDTRNPLPELPFTIEKAPTKDADITVTWMDLSDEGLLGDATPVIEGDRIVSCAIRLDNLWAERDTILHELGHCLGLFGHSEPGTLMAANQDPKIQGVTLKDMEALRQLYNKD